jgi:transposase
MSSEYPTAICRSCGKVIYHSEGKVNKDGSWTCLECGAKKK